jgi:hypothetical protein
MIKYQAVEGSNIIGASVDGRSRTLAMCFTVVVT